MKRMKHSKKAKYIGIGLASLGAVSVFSIGFASWVIGATDVEQIGTITVDTADVQTEELTLTLATTGNDTNISFGPDGTSESGGLIYSTGEDEEDLEATVKFTLQSANRTVARNLNFHITYAENSGIGSLVSKNYITIPFTTETSIATLAQTGALTANTGTGWTVTIDPTTNPNSVSTSVTYTVTVTLNFGWGSAFGNANPITMTSSSSNGSGGTWDRSSLKSALDELAAVDPGSLTLTISSSTAS